MARIARVIAAGIPHHVTQRGNRRLPTFFSDDDYQTYIALMSEWCQKCSVEIWAYKTSQHVAGKDEEVKGAGDGHSIKNGIF